MNEHYKRLKFLIDRSNYLYQKYRKEPIYINALLIKRVNHEIIDLLLKKGHIFNCDNEINLILNHFEVWYFQFSDLEKNVSTLSEEFIFQRIRQSSPYPIEAINTLFKK